MNIFVFGVGSSGTTITYALVQKMLSKLFPDGFRSTYEPFIWDRRIFNCPYDDAKKHFGKTSSLSIEGIYQHMQLPLIVDSSASPKYLDNTFFRHFRWTYKPHVAKFIRGNGRMEIFRILNPKAKFVLIIRNPVDVINSAKNKFSFYGDDFYPSDFPRFCMQLKRSGELILDQNTASWAEKQAEYCYQMCRAALEFAVQDENTLVVEYEKLSTHGPEVVEQLCHHLGTKYEEEYAELLDKPFGPITSSITLSQEEFEDILPYSNHYRELLSKYLNLPLRSLDDTLKNYRGKCVAQSKNISIEGVTTNRLRNEIRKRDQLIARLMSDSTA